MAEYALPVEVQPEIAREGFPCYVYNPTLEPITVQALGFTYIFNPGEQKYLGYDRFLVMTGREHKALLYGLALWQETPGELQAFGNDPLELKYRKCIEALRRRVNFCKQRLNWERSAEAKIRAPGQTASQFYKDANFLQVEKIEQELRDAEALLYKWMQGNPFKQAVKQEVKEGPKASFTEADIEAYLKSKQKGKPGRKPKKQDFEGAMRNESSAIETAHP